MKDRYVLEALQKGVIAAVAASINPSLPIKAVGRITPDNDGKYLEIVHVPNNIQGEFWGSSQTYRGFIRLILHWTVQDEGAYGPIDLVDSIGSYFSKGLRLTDSENRVNLVITNNPNYLGDIEGSPDTLYPISVSYNFLDA